MPYIPTDRGGYWMDEGFSGPTWAKYQPYHTYIIGQPMPVSFTPLNPPNKGELFFIYGTLRSGHRNNHLLLQDKMKVVLPRVTANGFKLIELSNGVPAAICDPTGYIWGEVYEVQQDNIDIMEIVEEGYQKIKITVQYSGAYLDCYIWVWNKPYDKRQQLPYCDWDKHVENASYKEGLC